VVSLSRFSFPVISAGVLAGSVLAVGALAACGPSDEVVQQCIDQCLAASGCPGATDSCPDLCENERSFSNDIECSSEYESMLDCMDTAPDVCDQFGWCPEEVSTYFACFGNYCTANPDDPNCGPSNQGGSAQSE
jgi:hypothetical protein